MEKRITLYADDGMMLTDGDIFCKVVHLAVDADASVWYEIPESEVPKSEDEI